MIATAALAAGSNSADQLVGGVGVVEVVVGELLALHLAGGGDAGPLLAAEIEGAPTDAGSRRSGASSPSRPAKAPVGRERLAQLAREPGRDGGVIGGGAREGLGRQLPAQGEGDGAGILVERGEDRGHSRPDRRRR